MVTTATTRLFHAMFNTLTLTMRRVGFLLSQVQADTILSPTTQSDRSTAEYSTECTTSHR